MPSLFAASITVLPCGTCTAWPSTSMLSSCGALGAAPLLVPAAAGFDGAPVLAEAGVDGPPPATAGFFTVPGAWTASDIGRDEALPVLDVVRELAAEMLD